MNVARINTIYCKYYTKIIEIAMLHSSQSAPVVDGKVMEFVIFAIESAAQKLGVPAPALYNSKVYALLLNKQYSLITLSDAYITDEIILELQQQ